MEIVVDHQREVIVASVAIPAVGCTVVATNKGTLARFDATSSEVGISEAVPPCVRHLMPAPTQISSSAPPLGSPDILVTFSENSVRFLSLATLEDVYYLELPSPPSCTFRLNSKAIIIGTKGGSLVVVSDIFCPGSGPQASSDSFTVEVHIGPIIGMLSLGKDKENAAWVVGGDKCVRFDLLSPSDEPTGEEFRLSLCQTMSLPEPAAAVALGAAHHAPLSSATTGSSFFLCASENFISLLQPQLRPSAEASTLCVLPSEQPLSALFSAPAQETSSDEVSAAGSVLGYCCTNAGDIFELVVSTAPAPAAEEGADDNDTSQQEDDATATNVEISFGDNFGIELDETAPEWTLPSNIAVTTEGTQLCVVTSPSSVVVAPLQGADEPDGGGDPGTKRSESSSGLFRVSVTPSRLGFMGTASLPSERPLTRQALTIALDTSDLELLSAKMNAPTKVRLVGDGADVDCLVTLPMQGTTKSIQEKLEQKFDRRLVVSFYITTAKGGTKLLELRPSTVKVLNAMVVEDRSIVCRPLFPQLSRVRSQTPKSDVSTRDLVKSGTLDGTFSSRPGTSMSHMSRRDEEGMVQRLYADTERARALKLLQLEEKFVPRAKPSVLPKMKEKDLLDRLTSGSIRKKEQERNKMRQKFEKEGYILPKPRRPAPEEEQEIIQKFYNERLKSEKAREIRLEKKLFKPKPVLKLKGEEEWAEWQEKRKRDIKKQFRLRDQYY